MISEGIVHFHIMLQQRVLDTFRPKASVKQNTLQGSTRGFSQKCSVFFSPIQSTSFGSIVPVMPDCILQEIQLDGDFCATQINAICRSRKLLVS